MQFVLKFLTAVFLFTLPAAAANINSGSPDIPPPAEIPLPPASYETKDPVDSLNNVIQDYKSGKYGDALDALEDAKKVINEKHLSLYSALLPPAPTNGWGYVDKPIGFYASVSREYSANNQTLILSITVDKNALRFASNRPINSFQNNNQEALTIKGNNATYQETKVNDKILSYRLVVYTPNAMVSLQSQTIGKDTLVKFAELVNYDKLKNLN